jgi:tRNA (guanine-N7-)-methyltransferase
MRLRNVKNKEEIMKNSSLLIVDYPSKKNHWNEEFNNNNPIYIEIGMGKGDFILGNALTYPDINFIGIEKYDSVLVRAIEKIDSKKLNNIYFIREDALNIEKIFEKEISKIYLNFSDPWPKERHAKRRLTSSNLLSKYDNIFKENKIIQMKTDNRHLFEYSLISMIEYGYKISEISLDLYEDDIKDNIPTEYETKFVNQGKNIYRAVFIKD